MAGSTGSEQVLNIINDVDESGKVSSNGEHDTDRKEEMNGEHDMDGQGGMVVKGNTAGQADMETNGDVVGQSGMDVEGDADKIGGTDSQVVAAGQGDMVVEDNTAGQVDADGQADLDTNGDVVGQSGVGPEGDADEKGGTDSQVVAASQGDMVVEGNTAVQVDTDGPADMDIDGDGDGASGMDVKGDRDIESDTAGQGVMNVEKACKFSLVGQVNTDDEVETDDEEIHIRIYDDDDSISEFSVESFGSTRQRPKKGRLNFDSRKSVERELLELSDKYSFDNRRSQSNVPRSLSRNICTRGRRTGAGNNPTLFQRGVTFNGFAHRLEPAEITGHSFYNQSELVYHVRWRGHNTKSFYIETSLLRKYCPRMLVNYHEKQVVNEFLRDEIKRYTYKKHMRSDRGSES